MAEVDSKYEAGVEEMRLEAIYAVEEWHKSPEGLDKETFTNAEVHNIISALAEDIRNAKVFAESAA